MLCLARGIEAECQNLLGKLDLEIADAERQLTFWRQELELQAGTELAGQVRRINTGYELQLKELRRAREMLDLA